jgi:hypothetical protein
MNCPHCNEPVSNETAHHAQYTDAAFWPWGCQPFNWREEASRLRAQLAERDAQCAAMRKALTFYAQGRGMQGEIALRCLQESDAGTALLNELRALREQATYYAGWEARMEELSRTLRKMREVLTIDEWCQACKRKPTAAGHASDCVVAAALAVG